MEVYMDDMLVKNSKIKSLILKNLYSIVQQSMIWGWTRRSAHWLWNQENFWGSYSFIKELRQPKKLYGNSQDENPDFGGGSAKVDR